MEAWSTVGNNIRLGLFRKCLARGGIHKEFVSVHRVDTRNAPR